MKIVKLLLCLIVIAFGFSFSEGQSWLWGRQGNYIKNTLSIGEGEFVAQDASHNLFFTGLFSDTLRFGRDTLYDNNHSYTAAEIFLIKYDKNGNVIWAKQASTSGPNIVYSIMCDKTGNVYLTGVYYAPITFDSLTLLPSFSGKPEMFIVKFDNNGNVIWARNSSSPSSTSSAIGFSCASDLNNNVYVTGYFVDTVFFNLITLTCSNANSALYILKYDSAGNVVWAKTSLNTQPITRGYSITTDLTGNVIVAGWFYDTLRLGTSSYLISMYGDLFLAKYDSLGNFIWAQQSKTYNNKTSLGDPIPSFYLTTDLASNIYVTGGFDDSVTIGAKTLYCPDGINRADIFIAKYNYSGNQIWVQQSFSNSPSAGWHGYSISTDNFANLYLSGGGNATIATSISFNGDTLHYSAAGDDAIIVKFDSSGNPLCMIGLLSGGDDNNSLAIDKTGAFAFLGGDIIINDSLILGNDTLIATSSSEVPFIARLNFCNIDEGYRQLSNPVESFMVFPNPNSGKFTIQTSNQQIMANSSIEVYNVLGEEVYSNSYQPLSASWRIDLSSNPTGVYLFRVISENGTIAGEGKFVIEK